MSYTSEQLPNFIKIDTLPKTQIAFKIGEGYRIPTQNECISYLLEQLKLEKDKNEIQQAVLNDLLVRMTALERK